LKKGKLYMILGGSGLAIVIFSVFLMTAGRTIGQFFFGRGFAEGELRSYASKVLKQEINGASCQAMDTDGNGYVSCDYTTISNPNVTSSLECSAWGLDGFLNRGCKTRLPNFSQ
jgi:hypothetical protein